MLKKAPTPWQSKEEKENLKMDKGKSGLQSGYDKKKEKTDQANTGQDKSQRGG